jgi:Na+-driven multidrug efflux pump
MGIAGAAWATFLSWFLGGVYVANALFGGNGHFKISFSDLILKSWLLREVVGLSLSSFARQFSSSLMMMVLNLSLVYYSDDLALAAFGIMMRIVMMTIMPIMGIVQGSMPIIGTNYGALELGRVRETLKLSIKVATIFSFISFLIIMFSSSFLLSIFTSDKELIEGYKNVLRIIVIGLPLIGSQAVIGGFYQALGRAKPAFIISMMRQIILFIPLMLVLPLFFNVKGIYFSFPISDIMAAIISFLVLNHTLKEFKYKF